MCLKEDQNKSLEQLEAEHKAAATKKVVPVIQLVEFKEGFVELPKPVALAEEPIKRPLFYIKISRPRV